MIQRHEAGLHSLRHGNMNGVRQSEFQIEAAHQERRIGNIRLVDFDHDRAGGDPVIKGLKQRIGLRSGFSTHGDKAGDRS